MPLKFKPKNNFIIENNKIDQITKDLDTTFKTIGDELSKLRENPIVKLFFEMNEHDAQILIEKIKSL